MKKTETQQKDPVSEAVRDLRTALGESQQAFAYRMKTAIRTIARYETVRPPKGKALAEFARVADETGSGRTAKVFREALMAELPAVSELTKFGLRASTALPPIRTEIGRVADVLRDENVAPEIRIAQAITRLDGLVANIVKTFRPHFPKHAQLERESE
jgi:transcriptional regulator with XRE-family HTH domain